VTWLALAGCSGQEGDPPAPPDVALQGVVAAVRTLDGAPVPDAAVEAGTGDDARPDSASTTYFYDLAPGRAPIVGRAPGRPWAATAPQVEPEGLAATDLRFAPSGDPVAGDAAAGGTFRFGDVGIEVPAGSLVTPDGAPAGAFTAVAYAATPAERAAIPADQQLLANDDQLVEMELRRAWFFEPVSEAGERLSLVEGVRARVTVNVAAADPLLDGTARGSSFSRSNGWWTAGTPVEVDPSAGTVSITVASLGWGAVVDEVPGRGCVVGTVLAAGSPVAGAELRLLRDGTLGVDRATSDADGRVCVPAGAGRWSGLAYDPALRWMAAASGEGEWADGFVVELERWEDADEDRAFAGPGGDCDDGDPAISPNPTSGDGSWCGSDW
jgi:hypothetical protein